MPPFYLGLDGKLVFPFADTWEVERASIVMSYHNYSTYSESLN